MAATIEVHALNLVGELIGLLDLDELCQALLRTLREEFAADWCGLHEVPADLPDTISLTDPPVPAEMELPRLIGQGIAFAAGCCC